MLLLQPPSSLIAHYVIFNIYTLLYNVDKVKISYAKKLSFFPKFLLQLLNKHDLLHIIYIYIKNQSSYNAVIAPGANQVLSGRPNQ